MKTKLNQDANSIIESLDVKELVNDFLEKERRKALRGGFVKIKDPVYSVNDRYRTLLSKQVKQTLDVKKEVFQQALKGVKGITRNEYLSALRDTIFNRLLSNFKFLRDCLELKLSPFIVALNIAMAGVRQVDKVLTLGIEVVYKDAMDSLKDEIFTERELALAKFNSVTNTASDLQLNEAERLIAAMKQVLDLVQKQE